MELAPLLFGQVYYYHREGSDGPKAGGSSVQDVASGSDYGQFEKPRSHAGESVHRRGAQ
jgi:hypothetical protein